MSLFGRRRLFFWPNAEENQNSSEFFRHKSAFSLVGVAVLALGLTACKEETAPQQIIRPVKAIVVQREAGDLIKTFSGEIKARTESALGFRVSGKIIERLVDTGNKIKAGQVIARLDDTDLVLSENSARAAVSSAKTRLAVAKDALTRAQTLLPKGYTPESTVDQRKLETDAAQSALEAAEAQARQATNAAGYAVLKADKDGIVTAVRAEAGQVVEAGAPVIMLAESGDTEVALSVPEQDVVRLAIGRDADLTLWADPQIVAKGKIREIAGQADAGSRTYAVRVTIIDPPAAMRLGMTVTAALHVGDEPPFIPLPITAFTHIDGRKAVFVADRQTSKVSARFVETDGVTADKVKVVNGLQPGEAVVTGGVQFLTDGKQVRLPQNVVRTASADQQPSSH